MLSIYFSLTLFILPEQYSDNPQFTPIPFVESQLSDSEIILGESFRLNIQSGNKGDYGDIHILSVAFPNSQNTENDVKIVTYDFTHSPKFIKPGDEIGSKYSGGLEITTAKYPSIEAMSRPIPSGSKYNMDLIITPSHIGQFTIFVKSINIPHSSELSHFPQSGMLDHQDEYVLVYSVNVTE